MVLRGVENPADPSALSHWPVGREGVVTAVPGTSKLLCRLREMGVVPGVHIRVLRTGTSIVVQVGEGRICLRREDAGPILVSRTHLGPPVAGTQ